MMRLQIAYEGGAKFTAECRGHRVTIDQPSDNGGDDAGMTPPELMATSLASCIGFYVARYCQQAHLDATGLQVACDWSVGGDPRHMEAFTVLVHAPNIPASRQKAVARVANSCLIHATLHQQPTVDVQVEVAAA